MTDRELLELAAKAAGMTIGYEASQCFYSEHGSYGAGMYCLNERGDISSRWNPLTDDGDIARLEATLQIDVIWHENHVAARAPSDPLYVTESYANHNNDKQAARRRASTRAAAAAIGARDE